MASLPELVLRVSVRNDGTSPIGFHMSRTQLSVNGPIPGWRRIVASIPGQSLVPRQEMSFDVPFPAFVVRKPRHYWIHLLTGSTRSRIFELRVG